MNASKTLIGAFVVGAIALSVASVLVFGSATLFEERLESILFFDGSVAGLLPGAPVLLGGVKIGDVKDITVEFNLQDLTFKTPVVIETYNKSILVGAEGKDLVLLEKSRRDEKHFGPQLVNRLVARGLRAQLKLQSFVTQQLAVELVFRPETEVRLVGGDRSRTEIPTIHSEMEELIRTVENLPVKEMITDVRSVLARLNEILSSPDVRDASTSIAETAKSLSRFTHRLDEKSDAFFDGARDLIARVDGAAKKIDDGIDPITQDLRTTMASARRTLDSIEKTVRGDSSLVGDARSALRSLSQTLDSLRVLADYLERHPEALLKGKAEGRT